MKYYCEEKEAVLRELCSKEGGLSSEEAAVRLEKNGKNRLKAAKGKSLIVRFLSQLADPMIIILLVAAAISGGLAVTQGESFADVIIILSVVIVNAVLALKAFDPYPFILLNLVLSCVAAIQAPLIMMSQNRQEEKDRRRAENDYKVNLKTEIMIEALYDKVNAILARQSALEKRLQEEKKTE